MKVINKLESYPTGDMIVPYCPNCDNPTYSERKCPFCNTELEYEEIIEKDKEIERLNNIINELEKWLEESIEKRTEDYLDWKYDKNVYLAGCKKLQNVFDKLQELKGVNK